LSSAAQCDPTERVAVANADSGVRRLAAAAANGHLSHEEVVRVRCFAPTPHTGTGIDMSSPASGTPRCERCPSPSVRANACSEPLIHPGELSIVAGGWPSMRELLPTLCRRSYRGDVTVTRRVLVAVLVLSGTLVGCLGNDADQERFGPDRPTTSEVFRQLEQRPV
jgi:hypothetical protein